MAVEMSALRTWFCILVLHVAALICAQDDQSGFISIDCGSESNYTQDGTGINYVSDNGFIEGGESQILPIHNYGIRVYNTLRSFPENKRNCYTLRPQKGKNNRYLIRAMFFYGESRGQPPEFDLYIGADYWVTVYISNATQYFLYEMIHFTSSDYIHVCLVKTGLGDPFITSLELRLLDATMYDDESPASLMLWERYNLGANEIVRYEDDKYDRLWNTAQTDAYRSIQTSERVSLKPFSEEQVPLKVMSTAITTKNSTEITYYTSSVETNKEFIIYLHFAEVEILKSNQKREFNITINNIWIGTCSPSTNITTIRKKISSSSFSNYNLVLNRTLNSTLPPILNAIEIYTVTQLQQNHTDDQDAAAIWSIKSAYGLSTSNWQGDPCVPLEYVWVGLNCDYSAPRVARIISVNLSYRGLRGEIATALANLTKIESLDLSYNNLTGDVPKFLARLDNLRILNLVGNNFTRPLPAELLAKSNIEESGGEDKSSWMHKVLVILALIVGCIVVLSVIVFIVKHVKEKGLQEEGLQEKALIKGEEAFTPRKQQFTYSEVVSITNNFQNEIGRGGFGSVFHGSVGDNQVAVKMLSESSSQGYKEFQSEVKLLMKIHHTNITSLVGYCDDSNHKGIIYDFMSNGNLEKHLFDGCPNVLSWERRLQIGCDVAEGLAYMHHGCRPPIVHRDVKSSNILLNEGFQAKLVDFGLSRAFPTEDASYVSSAKVAGTIGYLDPEYYKTYRLTKKSDVYSFGVVLLELITSRRATSDGIHIIKWVKSAVEEGNIENIIDSRLDGRFDINTSWKVVELAMDCVSPMSINRPNMNDVVIDLKHCLQAEETHISESVYLNLDSVSNPDPR